MLNPKSKSFSTRLSLNVLLIVTILFVIVLGIVAVSSHMLISDEAKRSASNILKATILDVEKTLQTVESTVKDASWLAKENNKDEKYLYHITRKVVEENSYIIGSAIAFDSCYFEGRHFFSPYSYEDAETGEILMIANMNKEALRKTIETGTAHYWSTSRNKLWLKGESSGHTQEVHEILVDCDMHFA